MQHVQINAGPLAAGPPMAHVFRGIEGKGKNKRGRTACGEKFDLDCATILAPMIKSQWGLCADCHRDTTPEPEPEPEVAGDTLDERPHRNRCDINPPSNGYSNQSCILENRHTHAHRNGRISWSGAGDFQPLDPKDSPLGYDLQGKQVARDRQLGEEIAATYSGDGPLGKKPNGKPAKKLNGKGVDALLPAKAPQELELKYLEVGDIERSPLNHRERFEGIAELGADIKANGLRVPIKVRPMPQTYPTHRSQSWELVYGERRWRAAKAAGVKTLPALIADLTDLEVIKEQLVENVSRMDVHPLEEADGYELLIEKHGYDVDRIASETGKSKATIYARLKLTALAPVPRKYFLDNKLIASIALLIARIPDAGLQEQATREVMGEVTTPKYGPEHDALTSESRRLVLTVDDEDITGEEDDDPSLLVERGKAVRVPMSFREASLHLQRRYTLRLELAKFPIDDAALVPTAGACTTCQFRTGNQRELFSDVASADVCTKPDCFADKAKAEGDRRAREAEAKGAKVVTGKAAEKVFEKERAHDHPLKTTGKLTAEIASSSPYVDPTETIGWNLAGGYSSGSGAVANKSWDKLLGKKLAKEVPSVVVVHPETGEARELLDKNKAIEVLRKNGKIPKPKKEGSSSSGPDHWQLEHEKREKEREIRDEAELAAAAELLEWSPATNQMSDWWRWLIAAVIENGRISTTNAAIAKQLDDVPRYGDVGAKTLEKLLSTLKGDDDAAITLLTAILMSERTPYGLAEKGSAAFRDGLAMTGLDWKGHVETAKKARAAADKLEADKAKAKAKDEKKTPAKKPAKKGRKK